MRNVVVAHYLHCTWVEGKEILKRISVVTYQIYMPITQFSSVEKEGVEFKLDTYWLMSHQTRTYKKRQSKLMRSIIPTKVKLQKFFWKVNIQHVPYKSRKRCWILRKQRCCNISVYKTTCLKTIRTFGMSNNSRGFIMRYSF